MDALITCLRRLVLRRWRHCLLICILIVVPVVILQWVMLEEERAQMVPAHSFENAADFFHGDWATSGSVPHLLTRALSYCNMPIHPGAEGPGHVNESVPGLVLRSVYLVVRHGDRAPMTAFKQFRYDLSCDIGALNSNAEHVLASLLERLQSRAPPRRGYYAGRLGFPNATRCERGQMTPQGVLQNFLLGYHLAAAYRDLVADLRRPQQVRVVVTRSARTFHSAAALLEALLRSRDFHVPLGSFGVSANIAFCHGSRHPCACPKLRLYFARIREASARLRDGANAGRLRYAFSELLGAANEDAALPNLNDLVDATMPLLCNRFRGEMCAEDERGKKRCLGQQMARELWRVQDRIGAALAREAAGIRYAKLVMFPFLQELRAAMEAVAGAAELQPRVNLFAGHDHTIRYLLTALGLYDGTWPPLASRLVFELYGPAEATDRDTAHRFRLLFNGKVLTPQLAFCRTELCPLTRLQAYLDNDYWLLFGTSNYQQACTT